MMKVKRKYSKKTNKMAAVYIECLGQLAVESSLINYTREWIEKLNRGGLFVINDLGYNLFFIK